MAAALGMAAARGPQPGGHLMAGWLVVSDIDHTLIEHPDQVPAAGAALRRLQNRGIPVLLASSKTFAEMVALQQQAGLAPQPFLFENGNGVGWPLESWPESAGRSPDHCLGPYGALVNGPAPKQLAAQLLQLRQQLSLHFSLLSEWTAEQIGSQLGLSLEQVGLALQRLGSLPLFWHDTPEALAALRRELAAQGLAAVDGGRLLHIGPPGGKGESLQRLRPWLEDWGLPAGLQLLACGDSENDRSLLESAAIALVFHPPQRPPLQLAAANEGGPSLMRGVIAGGPELWHRAVAAALPQSAAER